MKTYKVSPFEKIIVVKDPALEAALYTEGVFAAYIVSDNKSGNIEAGFENTQEVRQITQSYRQGRLKVDPDFYFWEVEHAEFTSAMIKQEMARNLKAHR